MTPEGPAALARACAVLRAAPLFADLDLPIVQALASAATRSTHQAHGVVFLRGEQDEGLYVVESGWLKAVESSVTGREQIIDTFGPGAILNDVAALAGAPTQVTLIALEPAVIWRIPREHIQALLDQHPALVRVLISSLASRVIHLASLVEDLALRSVEARLARLLLTHAQDGQIVRHHWDTQAELAAQIGTVPDVLSRSLRALADAGLIAVERRAIHILDRAGLEARAQIG